MLELVDSLNLSLSGASRKRSNRFSGISRSGGYSLTGKTTILHIVISGSSPDNSNNTMLSIVLINIYLCFMIILTISSRSSIGRANH